MNFHRTSGLSYGGNIEAWFTNFTGKKLDLIRKSPDHDRKVKRTLPRAPSGASNSVSPIESTPTSSQRSWTGLMTQWFSGTPDSSNISKNPVDGNQLSRECKEIS